MAEHDDLRAAPAVSDFVVRKWLPPFRLAFRRANSIDWQHRRDKDCLLDLECRHPHWHPIGYRTRLPATLREYLSDL